MTNVLFKSVEKKNQKKGILEKNAGTKNIIGSDMMYETKIKL